MRGVYGHGAVVLSAVRAADRGGFGSPHVGERKTFTKYGWAGPQLTADISADISVVCGHCGFRAVFDPEVAASKDGPYHCGRLMLIGSHEVVDKYISENHFRPPKNNGPPYFDKRLAMTREKSYVSSALGKLDPEATCPQRNVDFPTRIALPKLRDSSKPGAPHV